jgi:hypothetical protein
MGRVKAVDQTDANPFEDKALPREEDLKPLEGVRKISVTWGEESLAPIQYNTVRYGGITMEVDVPDGADPEQVYLQTWELLDKLGKQQFLRKLDGFLERAKTAGAEVKKQRGSNT